MYILVGCQLVGNFNTFKIQWGWKDSTAGTWIAVNLPTTFSNTDYVVVGTCTNNNIVLWIQTVNESSFKQYQNVKYYWIACGY